MEQKDGILERLDTLILITRAASIPMDYRLWDAGQIGAYLCVGARQVAERYACRPDFPRAIYLPTAGGSKATRRWKAAEVIEWAGGLPPTLPNAWGGRAGRFDPVRSRRPLSSPAERSRANRA